MTSAELHKYFKIAVDKENGQMTVPSFTPTEIDYWINRAQDLAVSNKFTGTNRRLAGIEHDQKRNDDFRKLIKSTYYNSDDYPSEAYGDMKVFMFEYPSDYMFTVGDSAYMYINGNSSIVDTIEAKIEYLDRMVNNRLSEHNIHNDQARPIKVYSDNKIYIYVPSDSFMDQYRLFYVKVPDRVVYSYNDNIDTFPDYMWNEIIQIAARLAMASTSDSRYSAYYQESQIAE